MSSRRRRIRPKIALGRSLRQLFTESLVIALMGRIAGAVAVRRLGVIALAVACLAVVGVVPNSVAQRTKEIGTVSPWATRPGPVVAAGNMIANPTLVRVSFVAQRQVSSGDL